MRKGFGSLRLKHWALCVLLSALALIVSRNITLFPSVSPQMKPHSNAKVHLFDSVSQSLRSNTTSHHHNHRRRAEDVHATTSTSPSRHHHQRKHQQHMAPGAQHDAIDHAVVATIATGEQAHLFADALLDSLNSNFRPRSHRPLPVYVFTDRPSRFDSARHRDNLHVHAVPIDVDKYRVGSGDERMELPETKHRDGVRLSKRRRHKLRIKYVKALLPLLVARLDKSAQYVVYVDSDVVLGGERHGLAHLVEAAAEAMQEHRRPIALFPDVGSTGSRFHTGVVVYNVAERERYSLLAQWGDAIVSGRHSGDQVALEAAVDDACARHDSHCIAVLPTERQFAFISAELMRDAARTGAVPTFVHTSKYRLEGGEGALSMSDVRSFMRDAVGIEWSVRLLDAPTPPPSPPPPAPPRANDKPFDAEARAHAHAVEKEQRERPYELRYGRERYADIALCSIAVGERAGHFAALLVRSYLRNCNAPLAGLFIITDNASLIVLGVGADVAADRAALARRGVHLLPFVGGRVEAPGVSYAVPNVTVQRGVKFDKVRGRTVPDAPLLAPENLGRLRVKYLKTELFRFVPDAVDYALFVDADMVIGPRFGVLLDQCVAQRNRHNVLTLFRDFGNTGMPYHTGVLFICRSRSAKLLHRWGSIILEGRTKSDQKCVNRTVTELNLARRVGFLTAEPLVFAFINGTLMEQGHVYALLHATFYRLTIADKFDFDSAKFVAYMRRVLHLEPSQFIVDLIPDAHEVRKRIADRERIQKSIAMAEGKEVRRCRYRKTRNGIDINWCA